MKKILLLPLLLILGLLSTLYVACKKEKVDKDKQLVDENGNPICTARVDLGDILHDEVRAFARP